MVSEWPDVTECDICMFELDQPNNYTDVIIKGEHFNACFDCDKTIKVWKFLEERGYIH